MPTENFVIEIEGEQISKELYEQLDSLEVELDDQLTSQFRLRFNLVQEDSDWLPLDNERFMVWKKVVISAGFDEIEPLISGFITHVRPYFDPDPTQCWLEIWGMDASVLMDREDKLKAWPDKKDSDIATEIFRDDYKLKLEIEDTKVIHDKAVSTIIQRETDIQFLKRLALRNGYECFVEGETGYFRPPQIDEEPQPVLACHFGDDTNVNSFSLEVNALAPTNVKMFQVDRSNKEVLEVAVESSNQPVLGSITANDLLARGMNPGQHYIAMNAATGTPEMTALCEGVFHQAEWFVRGEGEIDANKYSHILKARRTVTIKGIGEFYSGVYYVTHVTHIFTQDSYTQQFRVKRNAISPTGTEDFTGESGGLLGVLL